ncbi:Dna ligase, partial [Thalictrum thalictroides]
VGTGLTDEELHALVTKLKPYFRKNEYPKRTPSFYEVTHNSKERPDVWIESPEKSIILSITSDIRTIKSEAFAAPYSLRFPRIDRVRYDKPWHECLDVQAFMDLVHSSNGNTRGVSYGGVQENKPKRMKSSRKGDKKTISVVPSHFIQTDVSGVKEATCLFANMMFYFINVPPAPDLSLDYFHKLVAENGGSFSMNLNDSVTHCIAAERKGIKYQAAKLRGDVIHYSWVLDCCSQKPYNTLAAASFSRYFLFLADSSKNKLQAEVDEFSDSFYWDLDLMDIKQLFNNLDTSADPKTIEYYKRKYCPNEKWSKFQDCRMYFYLTYSQSINVEWGVQLELALRRLKLEVSMHGGEVSNKLMHATHLVVLSAPGSDVDFETLFKSFSVSDRRLLRSKRLHVVRYQWLEDSLEQDQKLKEETYSLKPDDFEDLNNEEREVALEVEAPSSLDDSHNTVNQSISASSVKDVKRNRGKPAVQKQRISTAHETGTKRKRGRPAQTNTKTRTNLKRGRMLGKSQNRRAKIGGNESENSASSDDASHKEEVGSSGVFSGIHRTIPEEDEGSQRNKGPVTFDTLQGEEAAKWSDMAHVTEIGCGNGSRDPEVAEGSGNVLEMGREVKKNTSEKLEVMADPLQAMLLDMIPSLGPKKAHTANYVLEDEKLCIASDVPSQGAKAVTADSILEYEKQNINPDVQPVKKKKVSYKDVANDLLKDWQFWDSSVLPLTPEVIPEACLEVYPTIDERYDQKIYDFALSNNLKLIMA